MPAMDSEVRREKVQAAGESSSKALEESRIQRDSLRAPVHSGRMGGGGLILVGRSQARRNSSWVLNATPHPTGGLESIHAMPRSATWRRLSAAPVPRVLPAPGVWGRPRSPWLMGKDAGPQGHSGEAPSSATLVTGAWTLHFLLCSGTWACSGSVCLCGGGAFLVYRGKP